MSLFEGKSLKIEIYGQSHANKIGVKVSGFPVFSPDMGALEAFLERRKPSSAVYSTSRAEDDVPEFSGIKDGVIRKKFEATIANKDVVSGDYNELYGRPRPSHADYGWFLKDGVLDFRGGGRFSGRLTAPFCIAGGLCKQYLEAKGTKINAYISQVGGVKGLSYKDKDFDLSKLDWIDTKEFPSITNQAEMLEEIAAAKRSRDSVGARIECIVRGFPAGIGDCLFDGLEGKIAALCYAVPAVKGVEFGSGFDMAAMRGSEANDQMFYDDEEKVAFKSNNSGGINGGISNGNYISFSVAIKPTPSIPKVQQTVDLFRGETVKIQIAGRHDSCIAPRALPVIESAAAIALLDEILYEIS